MLEKGFSVPELLLPALPQSISWFPLPPGWWGLGAVLLVALVIFLLFRLARWRRNAWRREALSSLQHTHSVDSWISLIKRILLMHQPRAIVSQTLSPEQLLKQVDIEPDLREQLNAKYCQPDNQLDANHNARLQVQLKNWLERLPYV
ncbi:MULTISPECIES: DUF4381 domain-containing protein [Raoultella]|uniref:DUF4381 domain-containing protein n=1 Tax=Raoultella TaxID=160674 RepID=UPI00216A02E0|nr:MULTISPECIES: DUF4381 domain-containing protein [Raoultella]MCS4271532.1 hypothetical protein [Raoultella sp. BIGb0132]MCS4288159.1 hypothetical protein [Raoultella terrigena]